MFKKKEEEEKIFIQYVNVDVVKFSVRTCFTFESYKALTLETSNVKLLQPLVTSCMSSSTD